MGELAVYSTVKCQKMDPLDVNHLNELLEKDVEIREVWHMQLRALTDFIATS